MKLLTKSLIMGLLFTFTMTAFIDTTYAATGVVINDTRVESDSASFIQDGTTMVTLRVVSEGLGANVVYDPVNEAITITRGDDTIVLNLYRRQATVNGETVVLSLSPILKSGVTYVPIRFISEYLGCTVNFDKVNDLVTITSENEDISTSKKTPASQVLDSYGRAIRTTNLPKNAHLFPYIVEGVPNWCYEQMPFDDNYYGTHIITWKGLTGVSKANRLPFSMYQNNDLRIGVMHDNYEMINDYIDCQLNIDYRTLDSAHFIKTIGDNTSLWSAECKTKEELLTPLRTYPEAYKKKQVIIDTEFKVLPETIWTSSIDGSIINFGVYVRMEFKHLSGDFYSVWGTTCLSSYDNFNASKSQEKTGMVYEGIMQYELIQDSDDVWRISYCTSCPMIQLSPKTDLLNGVAPSRKDPNRVNKFHYSWARESGELFSRNDKNATIGKKK